MGKLQRAIALCDGHIQSRVYEAAAVVANVLIQEGHWAAGRALLQLLTTLDPEDRETMERLIYINRSAEIPLLLKSDPAMLPCPPDAPWRAKFEAAIAPLKKAQWQEAADRLTALAAEVDRCTRRVEQSGLGPQLAGRRGRSTREQDQNLVV